MELAHEEPDLPRLVIDVVNGWIDQLGPCYEHVNRSRECKRIVQIATEYGFPEIPSAEAIRFRWLQAYLRWAKLAKAQATKQNEVATTNHLNDKGDETSFDAPQVGLSVDAAWSRKKQLLEYRGVWLHNGSVAFQCGPILSGSNNLGEFLAIVHGLRLLKSKGLSVPIYSDSQTAIGWCKTCRVRSRAARLGQLTGKRYLQLTRAMLWLSRNPQTKPIRKWDTENWDEIPADYGHK